MIYKGYELMKAVSEGKLNLEQKVSTTSLGYKNCTIEFVLKDIAFNIMDLDFELIEDEVDIDIDSIEHKELEILQEILGQCDLFKGNEKYILKVINENNSRLVDAILKVSKENEILLQAVKQLNKKVKVLKEGK
jgi:hypothetical protein